MYINLEPLRLFLSLWLTITFGFIFIAAAAEYNDTKTWTICSVVVIFLLLWQGYILRDMFFSDSTETAQ